MKLFKNYVVSYIEKVKETHTPAVATVAILTMKVPTSLVKHDR